MTDMRLARLRRLTKLGQLASLAAQLEEESKPKKKRVWVRDWIGRRPDEVLLFTEIQMEDEENFFANFRLSPLEYKNFFSSKYHAFLRLIERFC